MTEPKIRPPKFAGSFYPEERKQLLKDLATYFDNANPKSEIAEPKPLRAMIVPHAGYIFSAQVAASAYTLLTKEESKFIILGLSHRELFDGISISDYDYWATPLGLVENDVRRKEFTEYEGFVFYERAHENEHSIEVQLPFLQYKTPKAEIIPMVTGDISDHRYFAEILNKYAEEYTIIVSSDLSHYLPYDMAKRKDSATVERIIDLYSNIRHDEACGSDGINILTQLAKINNWYADILDYKNSGDTSGDMLGVVGYASIVFTE